MELSRKQIIELVAAHQGLDGVDNVPFKFSAKTRYSLAKNLRLLRSRSEDIDVVRVKLVKAHWPEGVRPDKESPEFEKFSREWEQFLNEKEEIPNLMRFTFGELNLDVNPIGITTLAILGPLLIEEDAP